MTGKKLARETGTTAPGNETSGTKRREFCAFKEKDPQQVMKIKDQAALLALAGNGPLRIKGNVIIGSDVWEMFPGSIEIDGNLRCSVLKVAGSLNVTGSINAAIIEADGNLAAKSVRAGFITAGGIEVTQHLYAHRVKAATLNAGSAQVSELVAKDVTVEYDLKCSDVKAKNLTAGTIASENPGAAPILDVERKTETGKSERAWPDF